MIEVILLEKIGRLGMIGQVVKVKPGFARNYLLPRKKALRATKDNLAVFESRRAEIEAANAAAREKAGERSKTLDGRKFVIIRQASEVGHLFGSVTVRDVATLLHDAGFEMERQNVALPSPIKALGLHKVEVHLHAEVAATITLNVARTEDEAKVQEKTGAAVKMATAAEDKQAALLRQEEVNRALFEKPAEEPKPEAAAEEPAKE
ncbi:MAG: 50S ribosomal protein L9 [Proteobacteria bacterium]|nr:50S ribosomal protein L9 [Pseudomonadota bacterium]